MSNFDAFTTSMQNIVFMLLNDKYYNIGEIVMFEIASKLGTFEKRNKHIYFARYIMLIILFKIPTLQLETSSNILE